jgi:hypothetical protein
MEAILGIETENDKRFFAPDRLGGFQIAFNLISVECEYYRRCDGNGAAFDFAAG